MAEHGAYLLLSAAIPSCLRASARGVVPPEEAVIASLYTRISMRRFLCRPARVALSAKGALDP